MTQPGSFSEVPSQKIKLLPEHLVDQIKAGEVIERPANLIKEIIENSLDAGATHLRLHLINNGLDLISLEDNGVGMSVEDLPYAFCRHATSKISRYEDLYRLESFGFRGEALASIASVSKVTCSSAPRENHPSGGKIIFHAGKEMSHEQQGNLQQGTSLYIKDLFFNTPARLKFIKSALSEKNAIKRIIDAFIIANPQVRFDIRWDDQDKEVFPIAKNLEERIGRLFHSRKKESPLWSFTGEYEGHKVTGFLSQSSTRGNAHKKHFLFGNSRLFTDRQIHQTILRTADFLYPHGESGHYVVFIDVPEDLIDVNVHPNKTQIKFFKLSVITALLSSEIKKIDFKIETPQSELALQEGTQNQPHPYIKNSLRTPSFGFNERGYRDNSSEVASPSKFRQKGIETPSETEFQIIPGIHQDGPPSLLYKPALVQFIQESIPYPLINPDKEMIPLMICEPLNLEIAPKMKSAVIKRAEDLGLQCEFLDESTLVLSGFHEIYKGLSDLHLLAELLLQTQEEKSYTLSAFSFNPSWIKELIKNHREDEKSLPFLIPLDSTFLSSNFSDEN